ncbi:hypothetical protein GCM10027048_27310 [Hymenobacter coalescens]
MIAHSTLRRVLLLGGLSMAISSCEKTDDALPYDQALIGRWELLPSRYSYPGQPQWKRSMEFMADGTVRFFRNDTLYEQLPYQLRRPGKNLDVRPGDRCVALRGDAISHVYAIRQDTLSWNSPSYKDMTNCFPVYERYARPTPSSTGR